MYPKIGEEFKLRLTPDQCDGIAMIKKFGYNYSEDWKYTGDIPKKLIIKCKLVQVGYCFNLNEVKKKLKGFGETPNGLFLQPFKKKYPQPDGNGPIGIADLSWVNPHGDARFPFVRTGGDSNFFWIDEVLREFWRWLVLNK